MKKLVLLLLIVAVTGCNRNKYKVVYSPSFMEDPVRLKIAQDDSLMHPEKYRSRAELNKELDSMNAQGEYILVRGADRNLDTIINHVHYIYTTEE